eukprot:2294390-Pyramimonas_sp.AAC.1
MSSVMSEIETNNMHRIAFKYKIHTVKMFVKDLKMKKAQRRDVLTYFRSQVTNGARLGGRNARVA